MRLGESDDGNLPTSTTQRQAYDLIAAGLRARHQRPAARRRAAARQRATTAVARPTSPRAIKKTPGVAAVLPPQTQPERRPVARDRRDPDDLARQRADRRPRAARCASSVLPQAIGTERRAGLRRRASPPRSSTSATGSASRLPYFIGAVVLLSFLLLMLVFHSILVPLTAAVMNLLSVGGRVRRDRRGVPVGLGQGPHRPREHRAHRVVRADDDVRGAVRAVDGLPGVPAHARPRGVRRARGDTRQGVVRGLSRTARVITSAALIMIFVFGAFVANPTPEVKMFGLGLAFAVLVDATIVRMMLVPSIMEILGDANWWFPKWLGFLPAPRHRRRGDSPRPDARIRDRADAEPVQRVDAVGRRTRRQSSSSSTFSLGRR